MNVLGINAYHGDAAACLIVDGELVGAVEEERFRRIKHWAGLPERSIRWCLERGGLRPGDLDHVAVGRNPSAHLPRKLLYALRHRPEPSLVRDRAANRGRVLRTGEIVRRLLEVPAHEWRARIHFVEHHRAHLASAFLASPFERAACVSVDGFGDFLSTTIAEGRDTDLRIRRAIAFPHSLGAFYSAATQYLGFPDYGDEYKIMGLAAHGEPGRLDAMRDIVRTARGGRIELDTRWFRHPHETVDLDWEAGRPTLGAYFSERWARELGPARAPDEPLEDRHRDIACSVQRRTEEVLRHVLDEAARLSGDTSLCLAGGCAYNSVANGLVTSTTPFERLFVPPAAGDAGTAVGAALWVWHHVLGKPRRDTLRLAALGPDYDDGAARRALDAAGVTHRVARDDGDLVERTARRLADGDVVGWFQGRAEWGPRALGQRSILADPRRAEMRDVLNHRIKRREPFRPFAPSMVSERAGDYVEDGASSPFMTRTVMVRHERRAEIPAVVHVDGTTRMHTVCADDQPLFHRLLTRFGELTGTPVLLNTSFNENEPIVLTPDEAVACFLRTRMDRLVIGRAIADADGFSRDDSNEHGA